MAAQEAFWLMKLLNDLGEIEHPMVLFVDNQSVSSMCNKSINSPRSKHIDICHHFVRDSVQYSKLKLIYCPSDQQLADVFTKQLSKIHYQSMIKQLSLPILLLYIITKY